jgi:4-hydroxythreonine-4-phosphate dehydrogenase
MPTLKLTKFKKIAITTGDLDGIGLEVSAKALSRLGPQKNCCFFIFRSLNHEKNQSRYFRLLDQKFGRFTFYSIESALGFYNLLEKTKSLDSSFLFDLALKDSPADWVMASTYLCKNKYLHSLVTGPISKTGIQNAGYDFVGHTGIFRHAFPQKNLFMGFVGKDFHVLLATDHIPISSVQKILEQKKHLSIVLNGCREFSKLFKSKNDIGVLGLNPHAGEKGILGSYEKKFYRNKRKGFSVPLSPDAAFLKSNWGKFKFYLAQYHDQGLIPFKMHHGQDSGVHITVGLPFVRTSVDHGTAKEIFNKNTANASSMIEAIELNIKLLNGEKI